MSVDPNLQVLLNYNFEPTAKQTGKVLALEQGGIKEIDLNTASIWTRIKLWLNSSLDLKAITSFVHDNELKWHGEQALDKNRQVLLEKQSARLAKKHSFQSHFVWQLKGTIRYPSGSNADSLITEKQISFRYNRLTIHENILKRIASFTGEFTVLAKKITIPLAPLFSDHKYEGDYRGASDQSAFLKDTDRGEDRSFTLTLHDVKEKELGRHFFRHYSREQSDAWREHNRGVLDTRGGAPAF